MPLLALAALILVPLAVIALIPVTLLLRYRAGTARRIARSWVATINLVGLAVSVGFFLLAAAITSVWVPGAITAALAGLAGGCVLGVLGLWLTRWERSSQALHYTPNRWLVLAITLVVTARLLYGFWRSWHAWQTPMPDTSWLAASGVAGSLAAGAVVLGYYVTYWAGIRRRAARQKAVLHTTASARNMKM